MKTNFTFLRKAAVIIYLAIVFSFKPFAAGAQALKATTGLGQFKNSINWIDLTGLNLSEGQTSNRSFTLNGLQVTLSITYVSKGTGWGAASPNLVAYTPGSWRLDGFDDLYSIGGYLPIGSSAGSVTPNTLSCAIAPSIDGANKGGDCYRFKFY
jgi:hypothetical protein